MIMPIIKDLRDNIKSELIYVFKNELVNKPINKTTKEFVFKRVKDILDSYLDLTDEEQVELKKTLEDVFNEVSYEIKKGGENNMTEKTNINEMSIMDKIRTIKHLVFNKVLEMLGEKDIDTMSISDFLGFIERTVSIENSEVYMRLEIEKFNSVSMNNLIGIISKNKSVFEKMVGDLKNAEAENRENKKE
jgi:hypothetical protein